MTAQRLRRGVFAAGVALVLVYHVLPVAAAAEPTAEVDSTGGAFADADNPAAVTLGRNLYRARCANCHGRRLEGQALWALHDQFFHQRAPAHDDSGHTWQHSDEELLTITRTGRLPGMPDDVISHMPAFAAVLDEQQTLAILAFIKSRWSIGIRAAQSTLNPHFRGMPAAAADSGWTFPPNCSSAWQP
jgi:mono/diheme cytochrome c family protein